MDLPNIVELCAGYGGIGLGLTLALGETRALCYVEREVTVARKLVARFQDGSLAPADIWSDLKTFDGRPYRGKTDILCAGYPCQPFSCAGKQLAEKDPRHLWPHAARIIREVQPKQVFLENVDAHLRLGFFEVARELRSMGYRVAAGLFSAEEVGAPHRRLRLFALAERTERGRGELRESSGRNGFADGRGSAVADTVRAGRSKVSRGAHGDETPDEGRSTEYDHRIDRDGQGMEDAARLSEHRQIGEDGGRRRGVRQAGDELADPGDRFVPLTRRGPEGRTGLGSAGAAVADAESDLRRREFEAAGAEAESRRRTGRRRSAGSGATLADPGTGRSPQRRNRRDREEECAATMRSGIPLFPPGPADLEAWTRLLMQSPDVEPALCRASDGSANRVDRLRALGNGVVPIVAAHAYRTLAAAHASN